MTSLDSTVTTATSFADNLRALAEVLDDHPELAEDLSTSDLSAFLLCNVRDTQKERLAQWVDAMKAHGAAVSEDPKSTDTELRVRMSFGALSVVAWVDRAKVSEKVVVGTETIEKVEWRCPALSGEPVTAGSVTA